MSLMEKELKQASDTIKNVLLTNKETIAKIGKAFRERNLGGITTIARGSSNNAVQYFKALNEIVGEKMVSPLNLSVVSVYKSKVDLSNNLVVAVSQSGKSTDTLLAIREAKRTGAMTVAVTNNPESDLAAECDFNLYIAADKELSVAATKTFMGQLACLYLLANAIVPKTAKMNLSLMPAKIREFLAGSEDKMQEFALATKNIKNASILTRGFLMAIANEMSLKLIETCYVFCRAFSTAEFMHGPLALIEEGTNVIMLAPSGELEEEFIAMATRLSLLGANIISFTDIPKIKEISTYCFEMPTVSSLENPFIYTSAIQLYAASLAKVLGHNPDKPRNLQKVTITV